MIRTILVSSERKASSHALMSPRSDGRSLGGDHICGKGCGIAGSIPSEGRAIGAEVEQVEEQPLLVRQVPCGGVETPKHQ